MPEVNAAEVATRDGQETEIEKAEIAVAEKVGDEATANETDSETGRHQKKGGWLRKLEKAERERDILLEALRKVGGNAEPKPETKVQAEDKPPVKPIRPKVSDFKEYEQYEAAVEKYESDRDQYAEDKIAYEVRQSLSKAEQKKAQESERKTVADGFAAQVAKAREEFDDFDEVAFAETTPMSPAMTEAIVTSEYGAKIAYELGQNPEEAERIARLSPMAAAREIGKIESRIANSKPAADEDEEPEVKEAPAAASRAPKPPSPVRRPTGTNNEPSDKDDYKTWLKKRVAQVKARNG